MCGTHAMDVEAHLELDLGLGNVLLAAASARNLLRLRDLGADGVGAEILNRETLNGIDAQDRVGLNNGESTRNCKTM
jgi:hypothetical protein